MAEPELEGGYTQIPHAILEHLMKMHLSPNQWQVLLCIIRKTCGWHKEVDYIANFQIVEGTGLCKAVVSRCLKELSNLQLISRKGKYIGFQKDWEKWGELAEPSTSGSKLAEPSTSELEDSRASESHKIAAWQAKVFQRDDLTCRICGRDADTLVQVNIDLHAHHIFPWEEYPELRFDVNNGLTMCDECHYCYHYAGSDNTYEFIKQVFEFKKLAEQLTIEKLAILHTKVSNSVMRLAVPSTKVSSPAVTQKIKDTITKDTIQKIDPPKKKRYFFDNILLLEKECQKLVERFGEAGTKDRLEALSLYKKSKGKRYKDDYATVLAWEHREERMKEGAHGRVEPKPKQERVRPITYIKGSGEDPGGQGPGNLH